MKKNKHAGSNFDDFLKDEGLDSPSGDTMTHAEIDAMVAGREMDALVAEKVMGWEYIDDLHWKCNGEFVKDGRPFNPSTNIADAWLVLEKMRHTQPPGHAGVAMLHCLRECGCSGWEANFCTDFGVTDLVEAETAPLAICKAALIAVRR